MRRYFTPIAIAVACALSAACGSSDPEPIETTDSALTCASCTVANACSSSCTQLLASTCGAQNQACSVGAACSGATCKAFASDAKRVCGSRTGVTPCTSWLSSHACGSVCTATSSAQTACVHGFTDTTCGDYGVYDGTCSVVCGASASCDTPCGTGGQGNTTCGGYYSVSTCQNDLAGSFCAGGGSCQAWLSTNESCKTTCTWSSSSADYCYDGEFNAGSTCGKFGVSNQSPNKNCMLDPKGPGCSPPNLSGTTLLSTCNDGTSVGVVPDLATRTWGKLSGPVTTAGTEQYRINALMNNAASAVGCTYSADANAARDATKTDDGFVKWYATASSGTGCGVVYFHRASNCAFALSATDKPPAGSSSGSAQQIFQRYSSLGLDQGALGVPTSLPTRDDANAPGVVWQRFARGYITYRAPDATAYYVGGTAYPEDAAIAARYGSEFDYFGGINRWPLAQDASCASSGGTACDATKTGRFTKTYGAVSAAAETGYPMAVIAKNGRTRAFSVRATIAASWLGRAAPPWIKGGIGYPTTDRDWSPSVSRYFQSFEGGLYTEINDDPKQTFLVGGPMQGYYVTRSASAALKAPMANVTALAGGGATQVFENAATFQTPSGDVFAVEGGSNSPALTAYMAAGGPTGSWGYPLEDAPDMGNTSYARMRTQRFQNGIFTYDGPLGGWWTVPPPVSLPAYFDTGARTSNSIGVGWYETGDPLNPQTLVYRQKYDLSGQALGSPTLIKTFNSLPQGNAGFIDSTSTTDDGSGPDPDRLSCYQVVEKNGPCGPGQGGNTCMSTPWACAYTRGVTPHPVGRLQLRIKMSTASTAAAPGDHVQARLQSPSYPYGRTPAPRMNSTWLDTSYYDFSSGSNITYDLKLNSISDLSDVTQITIATPDDDGLCINELELIADDTTAFFKSFGSNGVDCQWAWRSDSLDGNTITVSFDELRSSPTWQSFNPPNLVPSTLSEPRSFVGYRNAELIAQLDSMWGDTLRNPANGHGDDAGLLNTHWTSTLRSDYRHLHVTQHVLAQDDGWEGSVSADPSYDLVIHHDASCAPKNWCIAVENIQPNSSYSGWFAAIPIIGAAIQIGVNSAANGDMQKALSAMGGNALNDPPAGFEYCFPKNLPDTPSALFASQGFGEGSLTMCFAQ